MKSDLLALLVFVVAVPQVLSYDSDGLWVAHAGRWCNDNEWDARWAARTSDTLADCQLKCLSSSSCQGVTHGNGNCILCATRTFAGSAAWATTYSLVVPDDPGYVWEGSYNSTHGVASPVDEGAVNGNCKTQITVTDDTPRVAFIGSSGESGARSTYKDGGTCTSCNDDWGLLLYGHTSKAGICMQYKPEAFQYCTQLDGNFDLVGINIPHFVCTKIAKNAGIFKGYRIATTDTATRDHFASVAGHHDMVVAKCNVWKQTVCRIGHCAVKKEVKCDTICKSTDGISGTSDCDDSKCAPPYGAMACAPIAATA